jgi:hypothetical protein
MGRTQVTTYQTFIWKVGADQTGVMSKKQGSGSLETCSLKMMMMQPRTHLFLSFYSSIQNSIAKRFDGGGVSAPNL